MKETDVNQFLEDLNGGVFIQQLGRALSDVAGGIIDNNKTGQVQVTFDMKQLGATDQVIVSHKLKYKQPTLRGSKSEEISLETPMHVTSAGLSLFDNDKGDQLFGKDLAPVRAIK